MFAPVLVTPPGTRLISVADAKAHCRVDHSDDDTFFTALCVAAEAHLDGWTGILGRALVTQTWRQDYAGFEPVLRQPLWPVASITSITYKDAAGTAQTVSAADYQLLADDIGAFVVLKPGLSWPSAGNHHAPVSITYVAGQALADVPQPIKSAALLFVGDLYKHRETVTVGATSSRIDMSATVNALLAPYRRVMVW